MQLQDTEAAPALSYVALGRLPVCLGFSLGPVEVQLGPPTQIGPRNRSGTIIRQGDRFHLKVNHRTGESRRLTVGLEPQGPSPVKPVFYPQWRLTLVEPIGELTSFRTPRELPQLRSYA